MNILFEEHLTILSSLVTHDVKFMLVGGYAVIHYGYRRTTGDMDLWIKPDNQNRVQLLKALQSLEFDIDSLAELSKCDFTKHFAFSIGDEPFKVDFMTYINMVQWEEADKEKIFVELGSVKIPVIHLNHLILSKINNDRLKDKSDVEELQKIQHKK